MPMKRSTTRKTVPTGGPRTKRATVKRNGDLRKSIKGQVSKARAKAKARTRR